MVDIAILGYGTVGSGVCKVVEGSADNITHKLGEELRVKYICDLRDFPGDPHADKLVKDFQVIVNDSGVKAVVEAIGGLHPAYEFVKAALLAGKHVVTSNKELVAQCGWELLQIAREKGVQFLFEASVGGGTPIIRPLCESLGVDEIEEVAGIVNGTTNFMLSKMRHEGLSFEEALKEAQNLGYAETIDPGYDVDGPDACRKICILASLCFGQQFLPQQVHTEGIRTVETADMEAAMALGHTVKLVARAKKLPDSQVAISVFPALLPLQSQLASVEDVFNGVLVRSPLLGDVMFYGRGAGSLPTAAAVISDVIAAVSPARGGHPPFWTKEGPLAVQPMQEGTFGRYLRLKGDAAALTDAVQKTFTDILAVTQIKGGIAVLLGSQSEANFTAALKGLPEGAVQNTLRVLSY